MNGIRPKVGFVFTTKDRPKFTRESLAGIDDESGFDLLWIEGSVRKEGWALPEQFKFHHCHLIKTHYGVSGGATRAIIFGLEQLLQLGYDCCGIIENDIRFEKGWFMKLMELFDLAARDNLEVGAVTVRTIASRVLSYKTDYAIMYNVGAGVVLFTRKATEIILNSIYYAIKKGFKIDAQMLKTFYKEKFGFDLTSIYEVWLKQPNRWLGYDWAYAMELNRSGLFSLGSIPSMAFNMDCDVPKKFHTYYVGEKE